MEGNSNTHIFKYLLSPYWFYFLIFQNRNFFKSEEEIEIDNMPKGGGFTKPLKLSDDLAAIVGKEKASRAECVKLLWAYLKDKELQVHIDI